MSLRPLLNLLRSDVSLVTRKNLQDCVPIVVAEMARAGFSTSPFENFLAVVPERLLAEVVEEVRVRLSNLSAEKPKKLENQISRAVERASVKRHSARAQLDEMLGRSKPEVAGKPVAVSETWRKSGRGSGFVQGGAPGLGR